MISAKTELLLRLLLPTLTLALGACTAAPYRNTKIGSNFPLEAKSAIYSPTTKTSKEVVSAVKAELQRHGIDITDTKTVAQHVVANTDLVVEIDTQEEFDVIMYLKSLDLTIYDAKNGNLLVYSRWENPLNHAYADPEDATKEILDDVFEKITRKPATQP